LYGDIEDGGEGEERWVCRVVAVVVVVLCCMAVEVDASLRDVGDRQAAKK
jgi:hypothetical protein